MLWHVCALGQHDSQKGNDKVRVTAVLDTSVIHFLSSLPTRAILVITNILWELASLRWYVISFFALEHDLVWVKVGWELSCLRSRE